MSQQIDQVDQHDIMNHLNKWDKVSFPESVRKAVFENNADMTAINYHLLQIFCEANNIPLDEILGKDGISRIPTKYGKRITQRVQTIEDLIGRTMTAWFYVGLEFGRRDKQAPRTDDYFSQQLAAASSLLSIATKPLIDTASMLTDEWINSGKITKEKAGLSQPYFSKWVSAGQAHCFRVGLFYIGLT